MPNKEIAASATDLNHIAKRNGKLFCRDGGVHAEAMETAIKRFVSWLKERSPCILVDHNGQFDVNVLKHAIDKSKESIDSSTIIGFCDSKELLKRKFPDIKPYTQEVLADSFLHERYDAHEATSYVEILKKFVNMNFTDEDIRKCTKKFESAWHRVNYNDNKTHNLASFPVEEMKAHK